MIRPILRFGEPPLQARAADVGELTPDIQKLIDDMIETMYAAPGIGLAAPQIGVSLRIFVVDLSLGRKPEDLMVFINPEFAELEGVRLAERVWQAAKTMVDDRFPRTWQNAGRAYAMLNLGLSRVEAARFEELGTRAAEPARPRVREPEVVAQLDDARLLADRFLEGAHGPLDDVRIDGQGVEPPSRKRSPVPAAERCGCCWTPSTAGCTQPAWPWPTSAGPAAWPGNWCSRPRTE